MQLCLKIRKLSENESDEGRASPGSEGDMGEAESQGTVINRPEPVVQKGEGDSRRVRA